MSWLWATFEAHFFTFSGSKKDLEFFWKHYSFSTENLLNTFFYKKILKKFDPEKVKKTSFFRAINLSVNAWRSGLDICSFICGWKGGKHRTLQRIAKVVCSKNPSKIPPDFLLDLFQHNSKQIRWLWNFLQSLKKSLRTQETLTNTKENAI